MKVFLVIVGIVAAAFCVMVAYLYVNQRKILYFPQGLDRDWDHVKENTAFEYELNRDGNVLRGWLINPHNKKLLIYYGGNADEASQNIGQFKMLPSVATLLMNYRGYGDSDGAPTEKSIVEDALAIFDSVEDRFDSIVLIGRSLGSGVAVQVAGQRNVDRLILITPYDSIAAVGQGIYPWAPIALLIKDRFDSLKAAKDVSKPALFLIAENDTIIPQHHSRKLADNWQGEVEWVLIKEAAHNSIIEYPSYWETVRSYLSFE
ncbi:MAG: alpha/beta hydrolase [Verrucomicrobia bacterium]|nr:alpha/beta hydrolase [Verrucomicrobiota bacterium]MDA1066646.1 alpha/beta hydrolase [Verrucomicrobiota bacterium]